MKNTIQYKLLLLLFITAIIRANLREINPWYSDKPLDKNIINIENIDWMKNLKDNIDIRELAIPGTHDSCTSKFVNSKLYINIGYRCQSWTIEEQLIAGIRYFDLRPAGSGVIYHVIGKTNYSINSIFEIFNNFLNEHPSEGLIVRIQFQNKTYGDNYEIIEENSPKKEIYKALEDYKDIIYWDNSVPNVGKLRKKIFAILEYVEYKNLLIWDNNDLMELQDYFRLKGVKKFELEKKKNLVKKYLFNTNKNKLIINHCSAVGRRIYTLNKDVACIINKVPYKEKSFRGILIFDFPGEELINHVINQNERFFK